MMCSRGFWSVTPSPGRSPIIAAACPRCGDVLAGLADVGVLLREHGNADFPTPSGAVWAAIEQVTAPDAPVRSLAAARSRRSGMPRGPVAAAAAAAAVLAVAGFGFGRLTAPAVPASAISQPTTTSRPTAAPATPVSVATQTSMDGTRVLGHADLASAGDQLMLQVRMESLRPPPGGYLEVWLINVDLKRMVSVAVLDQGRDTVISIPAVLIAEGYRIVDVSNELFDDKPQHSGDSIMRGTLPA